MKANDTIPRGRGDAAGRGKELLDAVAGPGRAAASAFEETGTRATGFARQRVEDGADTARKLAGCRDLHEVFALQAAAGRMINP